MKYESAKKKSPAREMSPWSVVSRSAKRIEQSVPVATASPMFAGTAPARAACSAPTAAAAP